MIGAATFTVDPEDGTAPQVHEVQLDASAMAVLGRGGAITPQWNSPKGVCANAQEGDKSISVGPSEGIAMDCSSGG